MKFNPILNQFILIYTCLYGTGATQTSSKQCIILNSSQVNNSISSWARNSVGGEEGVATGNHTSFSNTATPNCILTTLATKSIASLVLVRVHVIQFRTPSFLVHDLRREGAHHALYWRTSQ